MTKDVFIHETADVATTSIGGGSKVWQYCVVLAEAEIGQDVNVCSHCFIENDVVVGDRVTIKCGVQLWDGLRVEDEVFIGPNVTFSNDKFPRSKAHPDRFLITHIRAGASIGAGAVVLPGIEIGANAMVGAGAVVTKSVPPNAIVTGSPARIVRYATTEQYSEGATGREAGNREIGQSSPVGVSGVSLIQLKLVDEIGGKLSVGEFDRELPFVPKRYFMVFDVPSLETRGAHAHKNCQQLLVCVAGSCSVLVDNGFESAEIELNSPNVGLYMPPMIWGVQYKYSPDAVLLVFASDYYDADDYVRDYADFKQLATNA